MEPSTLEKLQNLQEKMPIGSIWQSTTNPRQIVKIASGVFSPVYFPGWRTKSGFVHQGKTPVCKRVGARFHIAYQYLISTNPDNVGKFSYCLAHALPFNMKRIDSLPCPLP